MRFEDKIELEAGNIIKILKKNDNVYGPFPNNLHKTLLCSDPLCFGFVAEPSENNLKTSTGGVGHFVNEEIKSNSFAIFSISTSCLVMCMYLFIISSFETHHILLFSTLFIIPLYYLRKFWIYGNKVKNYVDGPFPEFNRDDQTFKVYFGKKLKQKFNFPEIQAFFIERYMFGEKINGKFVLRQKVVNKFGLKKIQEYHFEMSHIYTLSNALYVWSFLCEYMDKTMEIPPIPQLWPMFMKPYKHLPYEEYDEIEYEYHAKYAVRMRNAGYKYELPEVNPLKDPINGNMKTVGGDLYKFYHRRDYARALAKDKLENPQNYKDDGDEPSTGEIFTFFEYSFIFIMFVFFCLIAYFHMTY